jgi:hypothetical protein
MDINADKNNPPSEHIPEKRRKRGAQPGNKNALKHGFYARHFYLRELSSLKQIRNGLEDEIDTLRLAIQRMVMLATAEESSASDWQKTLQSLGLASHRLARLVKTHQQLTGGEDLEIDKYF